MFVVKYPSLFAHRRLFAGRSARPGLARRAGRHRHTLQLESLESRLVPTCVPGPGEAWRSYGLAVVGSTHRVEGNLIGLDITGTVALGNTGDGVVVGGGRGFGNVLRGNRLGGHVAGLGIRLAGNGNNNQAAPELFAAAQARGRVTVVGRLVSNRNTSFALEFFASPSCHPSGFGKGQRVVGLGTVTTDATGHGSFAHTFRVALPRGWVLTGTATDPAGNTSAFSGCVAVRGVAAWVQPLALDLTPLRGRGLTPWPLAPSDSAATTEPAAAPVLAWSEVRMPAEAEGVLRELVFTRRGAAAELAEWSPDSAERARPLA